MGTDKATLPWGSGLLVDVAVGALSVAGCADLVLVGGDGRALAPTGLRHVPDPHPHQGPLAGIVTALDATSESSVVVLACDLVAARAEAVTDLFVGLGADVDVVLPVVDGRTQYLHGLWRRRTRDRLAAALAAGQRSVEAGLAGLTVVHRPGLDPRWYADVDTPDDLASARRGCT
jgi:molybdopterin-guanine dinucleotide biosynthesis protein A